MTDAVEIFIALVAIGLVLLLVEVFIPGGIVGIFGALCLFAAVVSSFFAFGTNGAMLATLLIVVGSIVALVLWLKYFPKTTMGRKLTLSLDGRAFKSASEEGSNLLGKEGVAQTMLRPAGIAQIDNRRLDVVSESGYIESGTRIRVIQVEGNRVVVRALK